MELITFTSKINSRPRLCLIYKDLSDFVTLLVDLETIDRIPTIEVYLVHTYIAIVHCK